MSAIIVSENSDIDIIRLWVAPDGSTKIVVVPQIVNHYMRFNSAEDAVKFLASLEHAHALLGELVGQIKSKLGVVA